MLNLNVYEFNEKLLNVSYDVIALLVGAGEYAVRLSAHRVRDESTLAMYV